MLRQPDFLTYQLSFSRVRTAQTQSGSFLKKLFQEKSIHFPPNRLYIRIFKQEKSLEVWAGNDNEYKFIRSYGFTTSSGNSGPKQKEGDLQIPEGFYQLTNFNPESKFHLSLKINYPNEADSIRNRNQGNMGTDIYIHGGMQTTGCIPLGDENMGELYWLCVQTYTVTPYIPVHIFPCRMEEEHLIKIYSDHPEYIDFWNSMKPAYLRFQTQKTLATSTDADAVGNYISAFS